MKAVYLHTWAFSSKDAGGFNLRAYIKKVIRDCGLTCNSVDCDDDFCPETDLPVNIPRKMVMKGAAASADGGTRTATDESVQKAFGLVVAMLQQQDIAINALRARLETLEAEKGTSPPDQAPA